MCFSKSKKTRILLLFIVSAIALASCATTSETPTSEALSISIQPQINIRRLSINEPLQIVLHSQILDEFTYMAPGDVPVQFINFRKTIADALLLTFQNNFSDVVVNSQESGSGLELIATLATLQPDNALRFHTILVYNGEDVADVGGTTESRVLLISSTIYTYIKDTREKYVKPLTEEAIDKMCSATYDYYLRDQDFIDGGFWDQFK